MRAQLNRTLILLVVVGLIVAPPLFAGNKYISQAQSAFQAQDFTQAAKYYEVTARLLPWRNELWDKAGIARFKADEIESALILLEKARQENALSELGWEMLGISYVEKSDLDRALEIWNSGLKAYPEYSKYYSQLASVYHQQGDLSAERMALESWIDSQGETDAQAHYRFGLLISVSNPNLGLKVLLRASALDPEFAAVVDTMQTALSLASLETNESNKMVITGRGLGLVNEWQLARDAFLQGVTLNKQNAEAWAWLSEAEQQLGQEGTTAMDTALSLNRENPIVRNLRGLYWLRNGNNERALIEYLLAATYEPDNPLWQISIAEVYIQQADLSAALNSYISAVEIAPEDATVWRLLANFCAQYNIQIEEIGLPAAQNAVELAEEDPLAQDILGWTLTLLERYNQAEEALQQALSLDPQLAQAHLHFGIVSLQLDDWGSALDHLKQAVEINPYGSVGDQAQVLLNQYFPSGN
ncbi:MAG: tetratricopeptide repeat protein [Anaerolineae bacterium]|nr:tetratricopeptide repeat protein [Anaerolineae bacterium]